MGRHKGQGFLFIFLSSGFSSILFPFEFSICLINFHIDNPFTRYNVFLCHLFLILNSFLSPIENYIGVIRGLCKQLIPKSSALIFSCRFNNKNFCVILISILT